LTLSAHYFVLERDRQRFSRSLGGDTFFLQCEDNFTAEITTRSLDALQTEFGEKICVVLDNAPYFAANDVHDYVEDTPIELCHLPRGSPELNPAEMCWQKLNQRPGNQLFEEFADLREDVFEALGTLEPPDIHNYLFP
jgi:hypothetical protein